MGRMVSCKKCGAWVEVAAGERPAEVLCANCGGTIAAAAKAAGPARSAAGRSISIGPDSGAIGAGTLSDQGAGLTAQHGGLPLEQVQSQLGSEAGRAGPLRAEIVEAPPRQAPGEPRVSRPTAAGRAEALKEAAKEQGRAELARVEQTGKEFVSQQAAETVDQARQFVKDKGLHAVPQAGQFAKEQAQRIGHEGRQAAEQQLKSAAGGATQAAEQQLKSATECAAQAAHEAIDKVRPKAEALVRRHDAPGPIGDCKLCHERITPGDRVVICPECGSTYHGACYELSGHCPARASRPPGPQNVIVQPKPTAGAPLHVARPADQQAMATCRSCGARLPAQALVCPQCGRWLYSGRKGGNPQGGDDLIRKLVGGGQGGGQGQGCSFGAVLFIAFIILAVISRYC